MIKEETKPKKIRVTECYPVFDEDAISKNVKNILSLIGENPKREGLLNTPSRVARMYGELFSGYSKDSKELFKAVFKAKYDELVIVKDITFTSTCEHHMVPFMGKVHIGYVPNGKVLGLSKFARLVDIYARRLQIQEQMTQQVADDIWKYLKPRGVMVVVEAEHMCMSIRGVRKPGHKTITSAVKGKFRSNINPREEMLKFL